MRFTADETMKHGLRLAHYTARRSKGAKTNPNIDIRYCILSGYSTIDELVYGLNQTTRFFVNALILDDSCYNDPLKYL